MERFVTSLPPLRGSIVTPDDRLYAGQLDWGEYSELCEAERREREGGRRVGGRVRPVSQARTAGAGAEAGRGPSEAQTAGERGAGWDTRCKCLGGCWPAIMWLGYDVPL